jgi:uracil-DNA glycosylase family 4
MTDLPHPIIGGSFSSPVKPGTGWPFDLATSETKVAKNQSQVKNIAKSCSSLDELSAAISVCSACPGLVKWRTEVAVNKRKSFENQPYWGRPAAGFGVIDPALLVVGLAPAANGANRTGRIFTGDRSGDWLYRAMHKAGFATQPTSEHAGDGLELINARVLAAVRCAPPNNKPTPVERDTCANWFAAELEYLLPNLKVIIALGSFAWDQTQALLLQRGLAAKRTKFGHGAVIEYHAASPLLLIGSYHVSQQNTFTGRLTEAMIDDIFTQASKRTTGK